MLRVALDGRYQVDEAADGLDAYAMACNAPPAAIILDIAMPILDGWDVLRKLRTNAATKQIPIVIFTALERDAVANQANAFGVQAIVRKPIALPELEAVIRRVVQR